MFGAETRNIAKVNEVIEWLDENRGGLSVLIHPQCPRSLARPTRCGAVMGFSCTNVDQGRARVSECRRYLAVLVVMKAGVGSAPALLNCGKPKER
jgi:hypothetical protein